MKVKYILATLALILTTACDDDKEAAIDFGLNRQELNIEAVGGTEQVKINIESNWTAVASQAWVQVSPTNGSGSEVCTIKVDSTMLANENRQAVVKFISRQEAEERTIKIVQKGFEKSLILDKTEIALENYGDFGKRYFDIQVTSNVEFNIEIPTEAQEWLKYDSYQFNLDCGARPRTTIVRFQWEGNTEEVNRQALVNFAVADEEGTLVKHDALAVSQERSPEITPTREGDSLAIVICERKLGSWVKWDKSEPLQNWKNVTLWEVIDEGCTPENVGRVRSVTFTSSRTKEGIPDEVRYLTELESLSFFSNSNSFLYSFDTGKAICELTNLKHLTIYAFGLTSLNKDFVKLKNLVSLDLRSNSFQSLPTVLTPENFPNLRHLNLAANRRIFASNLTLETSDKSTWGGFYDDNKSASNNVMNTLFKWEKLESLILSNNLIKGYIPSSIPGGPRWTEEELLANDTLKTAVQYLKGQPKILPHCKDLRIGLNYLRGSVPKWLRYHQYLYYWNPDISIYGQHTATELDDDGRAPGIPLPDSYEYYFEAYPVYKPSND